MIDPASAIGIAAAAVQFFDAGIKAIRLYKQIHSSAVGATQSNEELEATIRELGDIRKELQPAIIGDLDREVAKTQKACLEISGKLLTLLENIKASPQAAGSRRWKNVSATWRAMRAKGKIEKLEAKLKAAESHFKRALTVDMRNGIAEILERQGKDTKMLEELCRGMQNLRPELQQARQESVAAHAKTHEELAAMERNSAATRVENTASHTVTQKEVGELGKHMTTQFEHVQMTALHREILESLEFPEMLNRQQDIKPPAEGTFEWVFTGESPYKAEQDGDRKSPTENSAYRYRPGMTEESLKKDLELRARLIHWLKSDESIFWVNGKAGSGKSSLMSFVANDERSGEALRSWSGDRPVHIIQFFSWRPGSSLQKSIPGLLRSLLWQLLRMDPEKIDVLLADGSVKRHSNWAQVELLRALESVIQIHQKSHICFFIDGLDEYDGEYMDLLGLLLKTKSASNIKTCLSSRPESVFMQRLQHFPSIRMQDLNQMDIESLVRQKLEPCGTKLARLVGDVTRRAEGIFLWAALVCTSLVAGHAAYDDEKMLKRRLDETPPELRELFDHMFSKIDETHRKSLMLYFYLLKWASEGLIFEPDLTLITASLHSPNIKSLDDFVLFCDTVEKQIVAQSKGLIKVFKVQHEYEAVKITINAWSLRNQLDHKIPLHTADWRVAQRFLEYQDFRIRWVHRTAHDCIFGESGEKIAAWLLSVDMEDLTRTIVSGSLWLTQWAPTTTGYSDDHSRSVGSSIFVLTRNVSTICKPFQEIGISALDEIHDLLISSFSDTEREICRKILLDHQVMSDTYCPIELYPLLCFWDAVCSKPEHQYYYTLRLDQLEHHPSALPICADLLWSLHLPGYSEDVNAQTSLFSRLLGFLSQNTDLGSEAADLPRQISDDRQWSITTGEDDAVSVIHSWAGSSVPNELPVISCFSRILNRMLTSRFMRTDFKPQMMAFLETRLSWIGPCFADAKGATSLLQLVWPAREYAGLSNSHVDRGQDEPDDGISRGLRLVCLHPRIRRDSFKPDGNLTHLRPVVVASFEIRSTLTNALLAKNIQGVDWYSDRRTPWSGTPANLSTCLQAISEEIWADVNHELDAWQQLYALACVKVHFRRMWRTEDSPSSRSSVSEGSDESDATENNSVSDDGVEED